VSAVADKPFLTDIQTLRERARKHIENGAVTAGLYCDRETVVKLLKRSLATEIVCVLRYNGHYFMASGINAAKCGGRVSATRQRRARACRPDSRNE
jgi:bacterioferritin